VRDIAIMGNAEIAGGERYHLLGRKRPAPVGNELGGESEWRK
jgi:hypothetical protein